MGDGERLLWHVVGSDLVSDASERMVRYGSSCILVCLPCYIWEGIDCICAREKVGFDDLCHQVLARVAEGGGIGDALRMFVIVYWRHLAEAVEQERLVAGGSRV